MAESPPRSDVPESTSGDELEAPQAVEDGDARERASTVPSPWGSARPWWSAEPSEGTGPHTMPASANGSGAHPVVGGTGPHGVVSDGTGPHGVISDGTGPHGVVPDGTGPQGVVQDGTGPVPTVPGQQPPPPPSTAARIRRLLLVAGAVVVVAGLLAAGVLVFRLDRGVGGVATRDATADVGPSTKVIDAVANAGGLTRDTTTRPVTTAAYPFIVGAVEAGGIPVAENGQAVYTGEPARPVNVLFMGGTGPVGDPEKFLQRAQPTTFIAGQDADPGKKGGKAVCGTFAVLNETHTFCAWATRDSYGIVASNLASPTPQFSLMSDVMRRIRNDVEKPRS
ncbi:MAG TPA: hypothetical protein VIL71_23720 [Spirillospora sp.]